MRWQRIRRLDDRINSRIGVASTEAERAAVAAQLWWAGPIFAIALALPLILVGALNDRVPAVVLYPVLGPAGLILFQSGFLYNERLRSLDKQSRLSPLRWRSDAALSEVDPVGQSGERL